MPVLLRAAGAEPLFEFAAQGAQVVVAAREALYHGDGFACPPRLFKLQMQTLPFGRQRCYGLVVKVVVGSEREVGIGGINHSEAFLPVVVFHLQIIPFWRVSSVACRSHRS